ncbi:MAG: DUF2066 domain-containing protein [Pseudomonadota bacterium]
MRHSLRAPAVLRALPGLVLLLALTASGAVQATVMVSVSAEDETTALADGLEDALVQVAGWRSFELRQVAQAMLLRLDEDGDLPALRRRQFEGESEYRLEFHRDHLHDALRAAGVPMVLSARPGLLVWAVHEADGQRQLLGTGLDGPGVLRALDELAEQRAMPLILPLGDLEDRRRVRVADIVGGVSEGLAEAGRRYDPEGLVLLRVRETAGGAEAHALVVYRGDEFRTSARGDQAAQVARAAVAEGLDRLGRSLARVVAEADWVRLGFVPVPDYVAFERLRESLARLDAIEGVRPDTVAGEVVTLQLRTGLAADALADLLEDAAFSRTDPPNPAIPAEGWLQLPRRGFE